MPLFLKPIFHEKVWGGSKLEQFGYNLPNAHIGECWGISAHPNGKSEIINGPYAGQTLDQVWNDHRELFGEFPSKDFPLMAKIVDAEAPLSIHVHPDDSYAYEMKKDNTVSLNVGILLKQRKIPKLQLELMPHLVKRLKSN